jgi:hypothetical protein
MRTAKAVSVDGRMAEGVGVGLEPVTRNAEEERPEAYCEGDEDRGGGQLRGRFSGASLY